MQYLAICEDDLLFQFMRNVAAEQGEVRYLVPNEKIARTIRRLGGKVRHGELLKEETYKKVKLHHVDQAIVFLRDAEVQKRVCHLLRSLDKRVSIVSLKLIRRYPPLTSMRCARLSGYWNSPVAAVFVWTIRCSCSA